MRITYFIFPPSVSVPLESHSLLSVCVFRGVLILFSMYLFAFTMFGFLHPSIRILSNTLYFGKMFNSLLLHSQLHSLLPCIGRELLLGK